MKEFTAWLFSAIFFIPGNTFLPGFSGVAKM